MTTIIRWNPIREMAAMQSAIDRAFDETWRNLRTDADSYTLPLDVYETEAGYTVTAALPGATSENIEISLHDNVLTIAGTVPQSVAFGEDEKVRTLAQERAYGSFSRNIRLPQPVDRDNIEATFDNGVLTLTLPKSAAVLPRQIPVRAAGNPSAN
ncbi:MAG: Hsp20/alpha crystallin family protein [Chloroflexi bacterium]|nr:Hsp20/alpha crystallin family protein [Chloroflexota bacterium]